MSSATTLGELKDDLRTNGIDYNGMTFYEGLSKSELKADESILPHDIERNGVITNELVFMLTNTEKKIRSGAMSRAEAYAAIKKHNLQEVCKQKYGKNFTQCGNSDLVILVEQYTKKGTAPKTEKPVKQQKKAEEPVVVVAPAAPANESPCNCNGCVDSQARAAIARLAEILYSDDYINEDDKDEIFGILESDAVAAPAVKNSTNMGKLKSPYTDDEINQMFRGMR